jgi:hypothetical protein
MESVILFVNYLIVFVVISAILAALHCFLERTLKNRKWTSYAIAFFLYLLSYVITMVLMIFHVLG